MDYRELHRFSRASLKGHYAAALRTAWLLPGLHLLYKLLPAGLAGLLMLRGVMTAEMLWRGNPLWMLFAELWALFCAGLLLPVRCGVWSWFSEQLGLSRRFICFRDGKRYLYAAFVLSCTGMVQFLAALPMTAAGLLGAAALRKSLDDTDAGRWLLLAALAFTGMVWMAAGYLHLRVSLSAVPVLMTEFPEDPAFILPPLRSGPACRL